MQVIVYTAPNCPYCRYAKEYLTRAGVPFEERDVSKDHVARVEMLRRSGQHGVPVIAVGDETIVGFDRARIDRALAAAGLGPRAAATNGPAGAGTAGAGAETGRPRIVFGAAVADASRITQRQGGVPLFGAYVGRVAPGSPAERAGLQPDDIITELNLRPITNADALQQALASLEPGSLVRITFTRGDRAYSAEVRV